MSLQWLKTNGYDVRRKKMERAESSMSNNYRRYHPMQVPLAWTWVNLVWNCVYSPMYRIAITTKSDKDISKTQLARERTVAADSPPSVPTRNIRKAGVARPCTTDGGLVPRPSVTWTFSIWLNFERALRLHRRHQLLQLMAGWRAARTHDAMREFEYTGRKRSGSYKSESTNVYEHFA